MLAYETLTGEHPFPGDSSLGTLIAHVRTRAPDVRARRHEVPRWLAQVIGRLLEKHPRDRFRSAAEALQALERRARPGAALSPRSRRRLGLAAAAGSVALALLLAVLAAARRAPSGPRAGAPPPGLLPGRE